MTDLLKSTGETSNAIDYNGRLPARKPLWKDLTLVNPLSILRLDTRQADAKDLLRQLRDRLSPRGDIVSEAGRRKTIDVFGEPLSAWQVVERICRDVREQGMAAVLDYSRRLDGAMLSSTTLRVPADELAAAHRQATPEFLATIARIAANIREFQQAILHQDISITREPYARLTHRYTPLRRIGICVPGGAAAYPSTLLMTAVPALTAGVAEIAVVAPPTPFGSYNQDLLATCHAIGVTEVYRVGGAHAVAALAYGVDGLPKVDKIVGPGNLFVALAKKHVYGEVAIDAIAGPSEVIVIADHSSRPDFLAADLLAQAEHAPGASILITWDDPIWNSVAEELERQSARLSRCDLAVSSLNDYGALVRVRDEQEALALANWFAPEHLHLALDDGQRLVPHIDSAGAIFLGPYSPVALGDYVAGPSHVLPTGSTARWSSGLSANDFLRSSSVIEYSAPALERVAADVQLMAEAEQLTAHRASIDIRLFPTNTNPDTEANRS